jgi:hypothetical protein
MNRTAKQHAVAVLALILLLILAMPGLGKEIQGNLTMIEADNYLFTVTDEAGRAYNFRLSVDRQVFINDAERTLWDLPNVSRKPLPSGMGMNGNASDLPG